jgi:GNAT superfamily N-acetyltransferase
MGPADLTSAEAIGEAVHAAYPEGPEIMAERLALYPAGFFVLGDGAGIAGYMVGHPWLFGQPPKLNMLLGSLPAAPDTFYLHDVALLPQARGAGAGEAGVRLLLRHAESHGFPTASLVAVHASEHFWRRFGFRPRACDGLASYGEAASFMVRSTAH